MPIVTFAAFVVNAADRGRYTYNCESRLNEWIKSAMWHNWNDRPAAAAAAAADAQSPSLSRWLTLSPLVPWLESQPRQLLPTPHIEHLPHCFVAVISDAFSVAAVAAAAATTVGAAVVCVVVVVVVITYLLAVAKVIWRTRTTAAPAAGQWQMPECKWRVDVNESRTRRKMLLACPLQLHMQAVGGWTHHIALSDERDTWHEQKLKCAMQFEVHVYADIRR